MIARRAFLRAAAVAPLSFGATGLAGATAATTRPANDRARTIEIWYGDEQTFGGVGNPQHWVNILGRVTDSGLNKTLTYSLNGGPAQPLTLGCDLRRLARAGDFNIELERASLREGRNDVQIALTGANGAREVREVVVNYIAGRTWVLPYAIDWSKVRRIHDVAEVVDGLWRLESGGVRTAEPYYDRVIAIGDTSWTDYEVETSFVYHNFMATEGAPAKTPPFAGQGAAGVLLRWRGHHDDGKQPRAKWNPTGGLATIRGRAGPEGNVWSWHGGESGILARQQTAPPIELGRSYNIKARVETLQGPRTRYSVKRWPTNQAEPTDWDLVAIDGPQDMQSGSLLFVVHHSDVTIGNISILPLSAAPGKRDRNQ
jgi:hypothetical protein